LGSIPKGGLIFLYLYKYENKQLDTYSKIDVKNEN